MRTNMIYEFSKMISPNTKVKIDISPLPPVQCDLLFIPYIEGVIRQIFCLSPSWSSQALTPNSMLCFMQASWRKDSLKSEKCFKVIISLAPVSWPDFLLSLCVCVLSCVQLFATPWAVVQPGSSVHGFFQARIPHWATISFARGASAPRDGTCVSCIGRRFLSAVPPGERQQILWVYLQVLKNILSRNLVTSFWRAVSGV